MENTTQTNKKQKLYTYEVIAGRDFCPAMTVNMVSADLVEAVDEVIRIYELHELLTPGVGAGVVHTALLQVRGPRGGKLRAQKYTL